ncbi:ATP-binding protein [Planktothrix mougeotii]|uniref:ATP-binding protein n=1 Tax=Planktothrix mougeotii LEGE 06226 TaxID=1828728 RepID=A0ABR9UK82_9CYAN|nr:ATP-binding protein [Planktothrix mougeotii]MBE9146561.1 ATP-binding protein [Planktothrix mougeotii LEGE 06226]
MSSLNSQIISQVRFLQRQAASLLLYQEVLNDEIGQAFLSLLEAFHHGESSILNCLKAYGIWFQVQAKHRQTWQDYLITQILRADNPFSQQAQQISFNQLSPSLIEATKLDLKTLQTLYQCNSEKLSQWLRSIAQLSENPTIWQPQPEQLDRIEELPLKNQFSTLENWSDVVESLANHYHKFGTGLFASASAFRWQQKQFIKILNPDPVHLNQLVGYETQRDMLLKNTEILLAGYPALNVLLYGSRGAGKSSLIKALLHQYRDQNLKLIEVAKSDLKDLSLVVEQLQGVPQKFIIFVDDLSFEEDDDAFKALKVVLEGNLTARPQNVVVYATSNRRHLVREYFEDRPSPKDQDEVHVWDTVQEKLSFSDRFGLTLTFEPADQNTYLNIVKHLAGQGGIEISPEELQFRALQWATRHNGRSGRTARQFIDFLTAELAIWRK